MGLGRMGKPLLFGEALIIQGTSYIVQGSSAQGWAEESHSLTL